MTLHHILPESVANFRLLGDYTSIIKFVSSSFSSLCAKRSYDSSAYFQPNFRGFTVGKLFPRDDFVGRTLAPFTFDTDFVKGSR